MLRAHASLQHTARMLSCARMHPCIPPWASDVAVSPTIAALPAASTCCQHTMSTVAEVWFGHHLDLEARFCFPIHAVPHGSQRRERRLQICNDSICARAAVRASRECGLLSPSLGSPRTDLECVTRACSQTESWWERGQRRNLGAYLHGLGCLCFALTLVVREAGQARASDNTRGRVVPSAQR